MKKNKIKIIPIISVFMLLLLLFTGVAFLGGNGSHSFAETEQSNENFYINVYDREDKYLICTDESIFNGSKAYIYEWENVSNFVLNFDPTKKTPSKNYDEDGVETYKLVVEIQYIQGYHQNISWINFPSIILCENIVTGQDSYTQFIDYKYTFNVDKGISGTYKGQTITINSWGIYRFRFTINGYEQALSDFFVVKPAGEIFEAPKIAYKETPSQVTLHSAYNFYLKNAEKFAYIDKSKLTWFVLGKAEDGASYCLTFSDINSNRDDFRNCSTALYDTWTRTGQTFYFDDKGVSGDWKVWCEYNYDGYTATKSNVQKITTGKKMGFSAIIWIIIGIAAFSILVSILICIYKNKRERIY